MASPRVRGACVQTAIPGAVSPSSSPSPPPRPLRQRLTAALVVAAALPVLAVGAVLATRSAAERRQARAAELARAAQGVCGAIDAHLARHRAGVATFAAALSPAALAPSPLLGQRLAEFHRLHPDFLTVLVADGAGRTTAGDPAVDAAGRPNHGRSIADRAYFREPMRAAPRHAAPGYLSDAFLGRGFGRDPIVAVSAAVRDGDGRALGIVEGSLDLRALSRLGAGLEGSGAALVVVDRRARVLHASAALALPTLAAASAHPLFAAARASAPDRPFRYAAAPWGAGNGAGDAASGARADAVDHVGVRCATADGWAVLAGLPLARVEQQAHGELLVTLSLALGAAALAGLAALALARRVADPLLALARALQAHQVGEPLSLPRPDERAPEEVGLVIGHLAALAERASARDRELCAALAESRRLHDELQVVLAGREAEVATRTAALARAEHEARERETRLREVLDALSEGVVVIGADGAAERWNAATEQILGLDGAAFAAQAPPPGWRLTDGQGARLALADAAAARARVTGRAQSDGMVRLDRPDGAHAWLLSAAVPITGRDGVGHAVVATVRDVSWMHAAAAAVAQSESRFRGIMENLRAVVVCLDLAGRVTYANPFTCELSGWEEDELVGAEWFARCLVDAPRGLAAFGEAMAGAVRSVRVEAELRSRDRRLHLLLWHVLPLHDDAGRVAGVAALGQDITEQRRAEQLLRTLSERDELTGLLNRRGFQRAVDERLAHPAPEAPAARAEALVAIDLDGFKPINDTFGHAEGDRALAEVATLLQSVVRGSDHAARLGGDEFAIYLSALAHRDDLTRVEARLAHVLAAHNAAAAAAGRPYAIGWSVGATLRGPDDDLPAMLARADAALYRTKSARPTRRERAA